MSTPLGIAVAIATTDAGREASLRRCIEAVAGGTVLPTRLLVVDQSGGAGREIPVASFPIEILPQPRLGLSASRNLALDRLEQEIVALTDDDCVPEAGWLAAVTGPVLPLPSSGDRTAAVSSRAGDEPRVFETRTAPWHVGTGGNMALNRARLGARRFDVRLGAGSPGRAGEDLDLIDRLLGAGERIRYEPGAVVRHERTTPARRLATRHEYGFGVGAMLGLGLRRGDPASVLQLASWLALRGRLAVTRRAPAEELRVLGGTGRGLIYGARRP